MNILQIKNITEGALLAAGKPLTIDQILSLFEEQERPERDAIRSALKELEEEMSGRGIELKQVASGYRLQVRQSVAPWVSRLWEEKPARYSRAFLETLALIAYRQPITRGEIESVRGVGVSSSIIRTMLEREWIKVVGHRDVPGKPALYGTSKAFLDSFNLKSLSELPALSEIRDLSEIGKELEPDVDEQIPLSLSANESTEADNPALAQAENDPDLASDPVAETEVEIDQAQASETLVETENESLPDLAETDQQATAETLSEAEALSESESEPTENDLPNVAKESDDAALTYPVDKINELLDQEVETPYNEPVLEES